MKRLIDIEDAVAVADHFVTCAHLACQALDREVADPLCTVLDAASSKLTAIKEALRAYGAAHGPADGT